MWNDMYSSNSIVLSVYRNRILERNEKWQYWQYWQKSCKKATSGLSSCHVLSHTHPNFGMPLVGVQRFSFYTSLWSPLQYFTHRPCTKMAPGAKLSLYPQQQTGTADTVYCLTRLGEWNFIISNSFYQIKHTEKDFCVIWFFYSPGLHTAGRQPELTQVHRMEKNISRPCCITKAWSMKWNFDILTSLDQLNEKVKDFCVIWFFHSPGLHSLDLAARAAGWEYRVSPTHQQHLEPIIRQQR